jgi:hypothetical protein
MTILSADELRNVSGGFEAGKCAGDIGAGFAAGFATTQGNLARRAVGGVAWGAEAGATSANCGDGTNSPAAMFGDFVSRNLPKPDPNANFNMDGAEWNNLTA